MIKKQNTKGFGKDGFHQLLAARYNLSRVETAKLFDEIGNAIYLALESGESARLFNIGALKLVNSNSLTPKKRLRFRESLSLKANRFSSEMD